MIDKIIIFTDGSCLGNPGKGGWGAILTYKDNVKEIWGGEQKTTNNRQELTAVIKALECIKKPFNIEINSDSRYVIDGVTKFLSNWIKNNWKTANKKSDVKNIDLWQKLVIAIQIHTIEWNWVKGHAGNIGNEKADKLANKGAASLTQYSKVDEQFERTYKLGEQQ
jgi:ribonuclease HI